MVTVAVAGGSGAVGHNVINAILEGKKHHAVVLSRKENPALEKLGAEVRIADYNDPQSLLKALEGVHTVISCIAARGPEFRTSQLALLEAAKQCGVKRFAPSEFAHGKAEGITMYEQGKIPVWEAVKTSGMEYTNFASGFFTNQLGTGTPHGQEKALDGCRPWNYIVNPVAGTADYAGDGNAPVVFTLLKDVGRYVAASLDLEKWPTAMGMRGDVKTFREVVAMFEKAQGRKWLEKTNTVQEMRDQMGDDPVMTFYNQTRIVLANKDFGNLSDNLNQMFPDIKPTTVQEFIDEYWKGVDNLGEPKWVEMKPQA